MNNEKRKEIEKLRELEEKYKSLTKNSPFGIKIINKEGVLVYINPKFKEIFGYTLEDIPKEKDWFKKAYPDPEYRKKVVAYWLNDLKKGRIDELSSRTFMVTCKDGSKKEIQFRYTALKCGNQFVSYEDITHKKENERKLSAMRKISREMILSLDVDHISKIALETAKKVLNFDYVDLFLLDEKKSNLYLKEWKKERETETDVIIPLFGAKGITAHVARTGKSLNIPDVRKDKRYIPGLRGSKSEMCVPMQVRDRIIGVMDVESRELNAFSEDDQQLFETLASHVAIAIENARLFRELLLLKELNEGIWFDDKQEPCTYVNPKMKDVLGHKSLVKKYWSEVIVPKDCREEKKSCEIELNGDIALVKRTLITKYLQGYSVIKVHAQESIDPLKRKEIVSLMQKLIGIEIFDEKSEEIVFSSLIKFGSVPLRKVMDRMLNLTGVMLENVMTLHEKFDKSLAENIIQQDNEVDKLYFFAIREISEASKNIHVAKDLELIDNFEIIPTIIGISNIKRIADYVKTMTQNMMSLEKPVEKIRKKGAMTLDIFRKTSKSFIKKDYLLANTLLEKIERVSSNEEMETSVISSIMNSMNAVQQCCGNIAECIIDLCV